MDDSFQHYLLSKQSVDDRALNQHVFHSMLESLPQKQLCVVEAGAGIGTMLVRLLRWTDISNVRYILVDEIKENLDYALRWLPEWAEAHGFEASYQQHDGLRLIKQNREFTVEFVHSDALQYAEHHHGSADLLIAHAFLDLLPMPEGLQSLFRVLRPGGLAWLTINFDGATILEPTIDKELDEKLERLYHQSMDRRSTGGDSLAGRHLFGHIRRLGGSILAAGASDWVVYGNHGKYPADEAFFLHFILKFFKEALSQNEDLPPGVLQRWLELRYEQVERGELVYIAHQTDFFVKLPA